MKHFLVQRMGFSLSDIDAASFNAAGAFYASNGYKFAFIVDEKIKPSEFIQQLARECRSSLTYRAGKWYLNVIPDAAPSAIKTIASGDLAGEDGSFVFSKTPVVDIANDLTAKFKRAYTKQDASESDWLGTSKSSDSASKTKYGTYPKEYEFEFVRLQAMADSVLGHMLKQSKQPYLIVSFPVLWGHFDLNVGDTIEIDNPLYDGRKFYIEEIKRQGKGIAEVKAVEWWA